ncbi:MAG: glutamate synthase subunit alpha, partial [Treponema sp.]|nr:glutamate synthase subunit alpha [Treponema sp.]
EIMAKLGFHTVEEMCGHSEFLGLKEKGAFERANLVDMSRILSSCHCEERSDEAVHHFNPSDVYDFKLENTVDEKIFLPKFEAFVKTQSSSHSELVSESQATSSCHFEERSVEAIHSLTIDCSVSSTDRTVGTILGSEIQKHFGNSLAEDSVTVNCTGGGGQSFGAFIPKGLTLRLSGDANDGLGKGLSGGKIVVSVPKEAAYKAEENIIVGNVCCFGATSGQAFINGIAGERFCVRNSGATVVAEGCGDHGLEYMTGGLAVILGATGRNLAAGMSGGIAYVLDKNHDLYQRLNRELVTMSELSEEHDKESVKALVEKHVKETGSKRGKEILDNWEESVKSFKKIIPNDYAKMLKFISENEATGMEHEEAVLNAFKKMTA